MMGTTSDSFEVINPSSSLSIVVVGENDCCMQESKGEKVKCSSMPVAMNKREVKKINRFFSYNIPPEEINAEVVGEEVAQIPRRSRKVHSLRDLSTLALKQMDSGCNASVCGNSLGTNDLSPSPEVDIEACFQELREENDNLRRALEGSNAMLRRQLTNFQEWQRQMKEKDDDYKKTELNFERILNENEVFIDRLKTEKDLMSEQIRELQSKLDSRSYGVSATYERFDMNKELNLQNCTSELVHKTEVIAKLTQEIDQLRTKLEAAEEQHDLLPLLQEQLANVEKDLQFEQLAKLAATKECYQLEQEVQKAKKEKEELEAKIELGAPVIDLRTRLQAESLDDELHRHHRRHRHRGHRGHVANLGAGVLFKGYKQYKTSFDKK